MPRSGHLVGLVVLLILAATVHADYRYASCEAQLSNLLESNITAPIFGFSTTWSAANTDPDFLFSPPVPTTTITINFQDAIMQHLLSRPENFTYVENNITYTNRTEYTYNNTIVYGVSMPYPWCTEEVGGGFEVQCGSILSYGMDKSDYENCPLVDKDKNLWEVSGEGSPYEAGRIHIVLDYDSPGCAAGTVTVTLRGVEASLFSGEAGITDYYTWSSFGINGAPLPFGASPLFVQGEYKDGSCSFHDGLDVPNSPLPDEMICGPASKHVLRCPTGGHPVGEYFGPTVKPRILCIDSIPGELAGIYSGMEYIYMRFQPEHFINNIESEIEVEFGDPVAFTNITVFRGFAGQVLLPDHRAWQIQSPYFNADAGDIRANLLSAPVTFIPPVRGLQFTAAYRTNNHQRIVEPMLALGGAFAGEIPPCICDITIQCTAFGTPELSDPINLGVPYDPANRPPIARITLPPDQPVPGDDGSGINDGFGLPYEFNATVPTLLDGSASADQDNLPPRSPPLGPGEIYHYWQFTGGPEEPAGANLFFDDPRLESPLVSVTGITGSYFVTHFVSDGQDYASATAELYVVGYPPVIVAQFLFSSLGVNESLGTNLKVELDQAFILSANNSFDPDNYPGLGLNATFVLDQGPSTPVIQEFSTPTLNFIYIVGNFTRTGIYIFTLTMTDGIYNTTRTYNIEVVPVPPVDPVFSQPPVELDDCETLLQGICLSSATLCGLVPGAQIPGPSLCLVSDGTCCVPDNTTLPPPSPSPAPSNPPSPVPSVPPAQPVPPPGNSTGGNTAPLYEGYPAPSGREIFVFLIGLAVSVVSGLMIFGAIFGYQVPYVRDMLPLEE